MDYSKLSDFEINKAVAEMIGSENILATPAKNIDGDFIRSGSAVASYIENSSGVKRFFYFDYCNSWADMGPIIEKIWDDLVWCTDYEEVYWDEVARKYECSKLRAAAIVYLMMEVEPCS